MTKQLFNFAYVPECPLADLADGQALREFLTVYELDGVEIMNYDSSLELADFAPSVVGVHLKYWPCWLDFYQGNRAAISRFFPGDRLQHYYGAADPAGWKECIRENIRTALAMKPEYLVWHVAESTPEEAFTFHFQHSNREVLQATLELYQEVFQEVPDEVTVLFENLWWPGLQLLDYEETAWFFSHLQGKNVGIMLDTGHLLNTSPLNGFNAVTTEEEAVAYLTTRVEALGELKSLIKGMHLNLSLSESYRRQQPRVFPPDCSPQQMLQHVSSIDQHRAFRKAGLKALLELVQPQYINHELNFQSREELARLLQQQLQATLR